MADSQDTLLSVILVDSLAAAAVIGGFWLAVTWMRSFGKKIGYSLAPLGFSRPRGGFLAGIRAGLAVGAGAVLLGMIVKPLSALVLERLGYSTKSTIQQPFMEGLVFRGAIFNGLYRLGGLISTRYVGAEHFTGPFSKTIFASSALVSSLLFALLHLEAVLLPILLILAITLCALFQRAGSLFPSFVAHATFNSFAASLIILRGLNVLNFPI